MSDTEVRTDLILVHSECTATVHAAIDKVDIADWLLNLPDAEYQRCAPPDHIAAWSTTTDDGRPMSINVEEVGGRLVVQHCVAETHRAQQCHMVSLSNLQTPSGWAKIQVVWDLTVTAVDEHTCQYTNLLISYPTQAFLDMLAATGQTFEQVAASLQEAVTVHNRLETPLYAASIEQARHWPRHLPRALPRADVAGGKLRDGHWRTCRGGSRTAGARQHQRSDDHDRREGC